MDRPRYQRHRSRKPYAIRVEAEERIRTTPEGTDAAAEGPVGERTTPTGDGPGAIAHERCVHHPGRAAVARCAACEEPICLACAVPVRGRVIGPECLAVELGDPALIVPPGARASFTGSWATVAGAVLAVVATIGPWTRTGAGDRLLGAWVPSIRWSMVAAVGAIALLPLAWWFRTRGSRSGGTLVAVTGLVVLAARRSRSRSRRRSRRPRGGLGSVRPAARSRWQGSS